MKFHAMSRKNANFFPSKQKRFNLNPMTVVQRKWTDAWRIFYADTYLQPDRERGPIDRHPHSGSDRSDEALKQIFWQLWFGNSRGSL